jgi:signal transduction histidine kinase
MEEAPRRTGALAPVLAGLIVTASLFVFGALFDLGPFREDELSRGELIVRADQICLEAHRAFADQQRRPPGTAEEAAELTDHLIGIASDEAERIAELLGPPEVDAQVAAYLSARERGIEALRAGKAAAEDGDSTAYERAQAELAASQRERQRLAREIGFSECSRSLTEDEQRAGG